MRFLEFSKQEIERTLLQLSFSCKVGGYFLLQDRAHTAVGVVMMILYQCACYEPIELFLPRTETLSIGRNRSMLFLMSYKSPLDRVAGQVSMGKCIERSGNARWPAVLLSSRMVSPCAESGRQIIPPIKHGWVRTTPQVEEYSVRVRVYTAVYTGNALRIRSCGAVLPGSVLRS